MATQAPVKIGLDCPACKRALYPIGEMPPDICVYCGSDLQSLARPSEPVAPANDVQPEPRAMEKPAEQVTQAPPEPQTRPADLDQLERLLRLRDASGLTEAEFEAEKRKLLDTDPAGSSAGGQRGSWMVGGLIAATVLAAAFLWSGNQQADGSGTVAAQAEPDAKALATQFFSVGNQNDLMQIRSLYAPKVQFYGKAQSVDQILAQKRVFLRRWPVRNYVIDANSMTSSCGEAKKCSVSGTVSWSAANPANGRSASGTADFHLIFEDGLVTVEDSKVLSRN